MNFRDLEYVLAIAKHGQFSQAAVACNVSQPTLSNQVQKAERTGVSSRFANCPPPRAQAS